MSDKANLYIVLGMSSNNVIECITIEGYDSNDVHYYIMENTAEWKTSYPFIYRTISSLMDIYKKQYKMDPNLNNFKMLIDNSDEFGNNFIKIIECSQKTTINACSYYQNNKKTITLKPDISGKPKTITLKDVNHDVVPMTSESAPIVKPQIQMKSKVEVKAKIEIKKKGSV